MAAAIAGVVINSKKLKTTAAKLKVMLLRPTAPSCVDPSLPTNAASNDQFQPSMSKLSDLILVLAEGNSHFDLLDR